MAIELPDQTDLADLFATDQPEVTAMACFDDN